MSEQDRELRTAYHEYQRTVWTNGGNAVTFDVWLKNHKAAEITAVEERDFWQDVAIRLYHDGPRPYELKTSPNGNYAKCLYCGELNGLHISPVSRHTDTCPVGKVEKLLGIWE